MNNRIVAGVDIGGTHITASLVNTEKREIVPATIYRKEIDSGASASSIIDEWSAAIETSFSKGNSATGKIGIAMPGPVDYETGVCYIKDQDKYESLYGCNLKELLSGRLGVSASDILLINDAAGFLLGEVFTGAARNFSKVIGLTLGTGFGSALYDHGTVTDADLWHTPFREGMAEDYLSARWLLQSALELTGRPAQNVKELASLADKDEHIKKVFETFGDNLGTFIAGYSRQQAAELIVLGGNISRAYELFEPGLNRSIANQGLEIKIRVAEMGEQAALYGAAAMWQHSVAF